MPVTDLKAISRALEDGKVDIALVRSDVAPPNNGQSLIIIRRDVIAIVLPPASKIESAAQLSGKTVALPLGPLQDDNSRALDFILSYFNVPPERVKRVFLPVSEIGAALRNKRAVAAMSVGPIGPGQVVDVVAAVARRQKERRKFSRWMRARRSGGGFQASSRSIFRRAFSERVRRLRTTTIKGVAVTYRFAVPVTMLNVVAGAITRSVLKTKARLMALTPLADQIEAPDPDEKNPILPVHPGVAAYLASGDQSFFDELQTYLYVIGVPLSVIGSGVAIVSE